MPTQQKIANMEEQGRRALALLESIWLANHTGNCGATNGEAVLCRAYAEHAEDILRSAGSKYVKRVAP